MTNTRSVISICCITYNHEKFIRNTIEGFLMQNVSFPVEIIIHDDCSTDNTVNIIQEYVDKHPGLIRTIYQKENQYSQGKKIDPIIFAEAKGKYIAYCEGDDYWTDSGKLQRQVDFLESNSEYIMVTENAVFHNLKNDSKMKFSDLPERDIDILDLLEKRQFATASVMFRNLGEKLNTGGEIEGDTILWCHLSKFGKIRYMENVSSVYQRHSGGLTGGDLINWTKTIVLWNNTLRQNHPEVNDTVFKNRNLSQFKFLINDLVEKKSYKKAFATIDEIVSLTENPLDYKEEIYNYLEEVLLQKDNSFSLKIGRAVTSPVHIMLQLKNKTIKFLNNRLTRDN